MKTTYMKKLLSSVLLVGILMTIPMALAEESAHSGQAEAVIAEVTAQTVQEVRALAEVVAETNPNRSAELAVSYNGLDEVYAGDKVTLVAKLTGYEGLVYTVYWQYYSLVAVDGQEVSNWVNDNDLTGNTLSLTLSRENFDVLRRVKIVITGVEGLAEETTGNIKDFSDERPAMSGDLANRPEAMPVEEVLPEIPAVVEENPEVSQEPAPEEPAAEEVPANEALVEEALVEAAASGVAPVARKVQLMTTLGSVINLGDEVTMTAVLTGFDDLQVVLQWQFNDGSGWKDIEGSDSLKYTYIANGNTVNFDWRLKVEIAE